ncbi:MAG: DUF362 domain-containing protein [Bacteroidales bacterium]|jgi:uncharacterized protein (DUF362 family)/Pyruvate/2-oxoacid:ferredoxin oxidoreductase delta subunit|nr:DUF362 domain-containing protein [Bacteroidales bacterium]
MNNRVAARVCTEYDPAVIQKLVSEIYSVTGGPDVKGRTVLVKPNILTDDDPVRCISTHPAVVEAVIRFLQEKGASVLVGDSPAVHLNRFRAEKSGIAAVCRSTGAEWVDFTENPVEIKIKRRKLRIAAAALKADLIISLPKFKNHELMYFTGAIKNTLGLVPGFGKARQHAIYHDRESFGDFLVGLNEAITPHYFLIDGIMGMEGPGPGNGYPVKVGLLIGSTNPLALDIVASNAAGYETMAIPTNKIALERKKWLAGEDDIVYDGPDRASILVKNFRKIPVSGIKNIALQFVLKRVKPLRKIEKRPVFLHDKCTGCQKCVRICPVEAIKPRQDNKKHIVLTDSKCIRCYCCSEVCSDDAIVIRRKLFGV